MVVVVILNALGGAHLPNDLRQLLPHTKCIFLIFSLGEVECRYSAQDVRLTKGLPQ